MQERITAGELVPPGSRVLVAVSGGPDSTALLIALKELGRDMVAAHFDHGLRPGSAADASWVRHLCHRLGIPLVGGRRRQPLAPGSRQAAARALRYQFLEEARKASRTQLVALAHTADDLVEGVLIHLLRGSGLAGLRGMPTRRGVFVRPLLTTWREEIVAFLASRDIEPRSDPTNADRRYLRSRVRHELLPALEDARPGIALRLHAIGGRAVAWHEEAEARADQVLNTTRPLTSKALSREPEAVRAEAYRRMYAAAGGPQPGLSRAQLLAIDRLAVDPRSPRTVDLPARIRFTSGYGTVAMERAPAAPEPAPARFSLSSRPCRGCSDPAAAHLRSGLDLKVGTRRPGLRLRPLGLSGTRKLQDILIDARVARNERDRLPLVFADGNLAWVPGVVLSGDYAARPGEPGLHVQIHPA